MPLTSNKSRPRRPAPTKSPYIPLRLLGRRLWRRTWQFTAGGSWSNRHSPASRHNLRAFWFDGFFADLSESIIVVYLSLFLLSLGASRAQIGLMNSLANLSAALLLLPGAILAERWGRRRQIVLLTGGGAARVALLLIPLIPLLLTGQTAVYIVITLAVARSAFGQLGMPAWTSLTADIVPLSDRGRYFSSRNIATSLIKTPLIYIVGAFIAWISRSENDPTGYQLAMGLSVLFGLAATFSYGAIREPAPVRPPAQAKERISLDTLLRQVRARPDFLIFCGTAALWNFSLQLAGPFFGVYLVEELKATPDIVGLLNLFGTVAAMPAQRLFGILVDRWGPRRVQVLTALLIPLMPWAWALTRSPWHTAPMYVVGGFLWAGYYLANFNLLLTLTPEDRRPRYSAFYQIVVMVSLAGGAALGGLLTGWLGYRASFVLSGCGRLAAALLFARLGRRLPPAPDNAEAPPQVAASSASQT